MRTPPHLSFLAFALALTAAPAPARADQLPNDPRDPAAVMAAATLRLAAGDGIGAATLFQPAVDAPHDWPFRDDAALQQARALEAAGQDEAARSRLNSWLEEHPDSPLALEARLALAWNHLRAGDAAAAARAVAGAITAAPWSAQDPGICLAQGAIAVVTGADEAALAHLEAARGRRPTDLGLMLAGIVNERLGRDQAAAAAYQELLDDQPDSPLAGHAFLAKGRIFASAESYRAAAACFDRTAQAATRDDLRGEAAYLAAACHFLGEEREIGLAAMQAVVADNAGHELAARGLFSLGEMLWAERRYEPAIARFNDVLSHYFADDLASRALYRIGRCLDALGRTGEATSSYQAVADGYPLSPEAPAAIYLTGVGLFEQQRYLAAAPYFQLLVDRYAGAGSSFVFASAADQELVEAGLCLLEYSYYLAGETGLMAGSPHLALQAMPPSTSLWRTYALLLDADALASVDRYTEAQATLATLLAANPDHAAGVRANRLLAWTYAQQSRADLAIATEQAMLARYTAQGDDANLGAALLTIAHDHFNAKRYDDAAVHYQDYVQRFPHADQRLTALYQEGLCYLRLGRSGDAVDTWRQVTTAAPAAPEARQAWLRSGDALFQAGHYDEARACYDALLRNFPDPQLHATASLRLARCDYNEGKGDDALARFRRVVADHPDAPERAEAIEAIAQILYNQGQAGDAAAFVELARRYPDSPLAPAAGFELALAAYAAGDFAAAASGFDALSATYPRYSAADRHLYYAADSHGKAGDAAAARGTWEALLRRFPRSELAPAARFNLARCQYDAGQYAAAAAEFARVLDLPAEPSVLAAARLNLAVCQRILGQPDAALALLRVYLAEQPPADPQRVVAARLAGEICQEAGQPRDAARYYAQAAAADPATAVELHYLAGLCLAQAGDIAAARDAFAAAIGSPDKAAYYRLSALAQTADLDERAGNVRSALRTYRELVGSATDPALVAAASDRITQLEAALAP